MPYFLINIQDKNLDDAFEGIYQLMEILNILWMYFKHSYYLCDQRPTEASK